MGRFGSSLRYLSADGTTAGMKLMTQIRDVWFGPSAITSYLSVIDRLVLSGTNFLTIVVVGRFAGLEELGSFVLAWTMLLLVNVVQESLVASPYIVFVNQTGAQNRRQYSSVALVLQSALSLSAVFLVIVSALGIMAFSGNHEASVIAWCLAVAIPLCSLREFARRFYFSQLSVSKVLVLDVIVTFLQFGGLGLLLFWDLLSPASVLIVIGIANGLPAISWFFQNTSNFQLPRNSMFARVTKRHWLFGRQICAGQIADLAVTHGVSWLIAALLGTAATGVFAACNSIVMAVNPLIFGIGSILLPRAAQANYSHGAREVGRIVWKTAALLGASTGVICLAIAVFGPYLVFVLYGLEGSSEIWSIVSLLAFAGFAGAVGLAVEHGLLGVKRPDVNLKAAIFGLVTTFVTALLLIPVIGLTGVALGILIGTLGSSIYQFNVFSRLVGGPRVWLTND
jgi:O-antigen/teichoic acid export membrane protein